MRKYNGVLFNKSMARAYKRVRKEYPEDDASTIQLSICGEVVCPKVCTKERSCSGCLLSVGAITEFMEFEKEAENREKIQ